MFPAASSAIKSEKKGGYARWDHPGKYTPNVQKILVWSDTEIFVQVLIRHMEVSPLDHPRCGDWLRLGEIQIDLQLLRHR